MVQQPKDNTNIWLVGGGIVALIFLIIIVLSTSRRK
jgi:hypothetical protein